MANTAKVRQLLETIRYVAPFMTDEEISEVGTVMLKALKRMEKEGVNNDENNTSSADSKG